MLTDEEISEMNFHSLRTRCSNDGLGASGNIRALRSRLRYHWSIKRKEQQAQQQQQEKQQKQERQRQEQRDFLRSMSSGDRGRLSSLASPPSPQPQPFATAPAQLREQLRLSAAKRKTRSRVAATIAATATSQVQRGEEPPASKRRKSSNALETGHHLVCPITLELPVDPVMAEDGRIYEKSAIKAYFKGPNQRCQTEVLSPYTRQKMSKKIIPSPAIRTHIESLVRSRSVSEDLATKWLKGMEEWDILQKIVKKAKGGDVDAMIEAGRNYYGGLRGFPRNEGNAYQFFDRARVKGNSVYGSAYVGEILLRRRVVIDHNNTAAQNTVRATVFLTSAAERGSDYAAFVLGMAFAHGKHGFPLDPSEARRYLKLAGSGNCRFRHLKEKDKKKIPRELERLATMRR